MDNNTDLIFLAILAGIIIYRLYSFLGADIGANLKKENLTEKIVTTEEVEESLPEKIEANIDNTLKDSLNLIIAKEPSFSLPIFLNKAEKVFEFILEKLSEQNIEELRPIVSKKVFEKFNQYTQDLKSKNLFTKITLISISEKKIEDIIIKNDKASITIYFSSHQISSHQDIHGNKTKEKNLVEKKEDTWVFSKKLGDGSNIWILEQI